MADRMYVVMPAVLAGRVRAALARAEGLPRRGVTHGGPEIVGDAHGPGWTVEAVGAPLDGGDGTVALEIPDDMSRHAGTSIDLDGVQVAIPALSSRTAEAALAARFRGRLPMLPDVETPVTPGNGRP